MNRTELAVIISLALLALFIWLRDTTWMSTADDTLPILAALPIFIWIGSPWDFRDHPLPLSLKTITGSIVLFLLGILTNFTLLLALGWTLLLKAWIVSAFVPEPSRYLSKLLLLPVMAFPWISLDMDRIGWWFRLSGAWTTAKILAFFGFHVIQEGTNILINTIFINVEVACAGLNTLQSMTIAGSVAAYIILGNTHKYWWNLPVLVLIAWVSNTTRIIVLSLIAITVSPAFAESSFHLLGGWFILIIMFCFCWLFFAWQKRSELNS